VRKFDPDECFHTIFKIATEAIKNHISENSEIRTNSDNWKTVLRKMWNNNEFDDKFRKTLEFSYAFQMGFKAASSGGEQGYEIWEEGDNGKLRPPAALQTKILEIVNGQMEKYIAAGGLTNRFSIRSFAADLMAAGYKMKNDTLQSVPPYKEEGEKEKRAFRWCFPKQNEFPNDKELVHFDDNSLTMHLGRFYEKDQWGREKMFVTTEGGFFDSTMVDSWIPIFWTDKKETWDKSILESKEEAGEEKK
jgi:hypothetical protein